MLNKEDWTNIKLLAAPNSEDTLLAGKKLRNILHLFAKAILELKGRLDSRDESEQSERDYYSGR